MDAEMHATYSSLFAATKLNELKLVVFFLIIYFYYDLTSFLLLWQLLNFAFNSVVKMRNNKKQYLLLLLFLYSSKFFRLKKKKKLILSALFQRFDFFYIVGRILYVCFAHSVLHCFLFSDFAFECKKDHYLNAKFVVFVK